MLREHLLDIGGHLGVLGPQREQTRLAFQGRQVQDPIEVRTGTVPAFAADSRHVTGLELSRRL
jgi:hypothetical protein